MNKSKILKIISMTTSTMLTTAFLMTPTLKYIKANELGSYLITNEDYNYTDKQWEKKEKILQEKEADRKAKEEAHSKAKSKYLSIQESIKSKKSSGYSPTGEQNHELTLALHDLNEKSRDLEEAKKEETKVRAEVEESKKKRDEAYKKRQDLLNKPKDTTTNSTTPYSTTNSTTPYSTTNSNAPINGNHHYSTQNGSIIVNHNYKNNDQNYITLETKDKGNIKVYINDKYNINTNDNTKITVSIGGTKYTKTIRDLEYILKNNNDIEVSIKLPNGENVNVVVKNKSDLDEVKQLVVAAPNAIISENKPISTVVNNNPTSSAKNNTPSESPTKVKVAGDTTAPEPSDGGKNTIGKLANTASPLANNIAISISAGLLGILGLLRLRNTKKNNN